MRSEGNGTTSGTAGSPNIIVHFTFYESEPDSIYFYVEKHNRPGGLSGVYTSSTLVKSITLPTGTTTASSWKVTSTGTNTCTVTSPDGSTTSTLPAVLYDRSTNPKTYTTGMGSTGYDEGTTVPNQDDSFIPLRIPWTITFLGADYTSGNVFLGSNTYLTFGSGSTVFQNLSESTPNLPKIMIGSGDNSFQKVFATSDTQEPTLGNFDMTKTFGDNPFIITQPTSNNTAGAFTYSVTAGSDIISIAGTIITILKAGSATVQASQAASGNYLAATKTATITINRVTPTLVTSQTTFYQKFVSGATVSFNNVISSNAGTVPRTHVSNNTAVVTIPTASMPSATIVGPGKTTIKVTQPATTNYTEVVNNDLITIVVVGQGKTYTSEIFPASFDMSGTNLSNSTFTDCTFTSTNLFGITVDASTNFSTCTFTGIGSGRITGKTARLPVGFTMI